MVYRTELTHEELVKVLATKYISGSTIGYTLPPGLSKHSDNNSMIKS